MRALATSTVIAAVAIAAVGCQAGPGDLDPAAEHADQQCVAPASASASIDDEYDAFLGELGAANPEAERSGGQLPVECNGETDDLRLLTSPCQTLAPFLKRIDSAAARAVEVGEQELFQMGFVVGVEGNGVLGVGTGFGGYDLVVDLYHHQMTASVYSGLGLAQPGVSVNGHIYSGFAWGFETGVSDWFGSFANQGWNIDFLSWLPVGLVADLGVKVAAFQSAVDDNGDGIIDPTEVLLPPEGVYGFTLGVRAGLGIEIDDLPIAGIIAQLLPASITAGKWRPNKPLIRLLHDYFTSGFFPINARLIDPATGSACPDDWPDSDGHLDCVIEFGDPDASNLRRSLTTARAICKLTGGCTMPAAWPAVTSALAINGARSSGLSLSSFCPSED